MQMSEQINGLAPDGNDPASERRIHIRDSCDDDVQVIASIYAHYVLHGTASFETEAPSVEEIKRRRNELVRRDYPYIVAEDSSGVVGYAYAGPYRPRPAYRDTVENSIYLRHDTIGRGIGRLLLNALIEMCERRDYRQLIAVVGDSANTASVHLHERAGFRSVGTLRSVGFKHGRWLDMVLLQRPLAASDSVPPQTRNA